MATTFSVAVLTAAPPGQAAEAGGAYVKIDGRESLLRGVELFLNRDNVKQIQVVVLPDDLEEAKRKYGPHLSFSGVKLVSGGPKWSDQIAAAAKTLSPDATHVILHDGARPAVSYLDMDALMDAAAKSDAAALVAPLRSALVEVDEGGYPMAYRRADEFVELLTPQVYSKDAFTKLAEGHELPASQMKLLKGSPLNLRIRGGGDAGLLKSMLNMLPKPKLRPPSSPFDEAQW
jgi:2-C-methyl-D-erythritol 4-phosphate cytidylyltransferase/2-C-methyl-D-erythritol 2,4-cyclodiphosphate synthase